MPPLHLKRSKDLEFYDTCEKIRAASKGALSTRQIAIIAEGVEASSFFLTADYICRLLSDMLTDRYVKPKQPHVNAKHRDIYRRYVILLSKHEGLRLSQYAELISVQRAPRFYYSEDYATVHYYKLINQRNELGKCRECDI